MDDYREIILGAKPGEIIPIVKEIDIEETVDFFATKALRHERIWRQKTQSFLTLIHKDRQQRQFVAVFVTISGNL